MQRFEYPLPASIGLPDAVNRGSATSFSIVCAIHAASTMISKPRKRRKPYLGSWDEPQQTNNYYVYYLSFGTRCRVKKYLRKKLMSQVREELQGLCKNLLIVQTP